MKLEELLNGEWASGYYPLGDDRIFAALMDISERLQRLEARVFGGDCEHGSHSVNGCRQCALEGYRRVLAEQGKE